MPVFLKGYATFIGPVQIEAAILLAASAAAGFQAFAQSSPRTLPAIGRVYRSSDGEFTVEPPPGWRMICEEEGSNEVTFLSGKVSVSVASSAAGEQGSIASLLDFNKRRLTEQCPSARLVDEGKTLVAAAPGEYFTLRCEGHRPPTIFRFSAAISAGRFYIFSVTSPAAQLAAAQPLIDQMAQSFRPGSAETAARERIHP